MCRYIPVSLYFLDSTGYFECQYSFRLLSICWSGLSVYISEIANMYIVLDILLSNRKKPSTLIYHGVTPLLQASGLKANVPVCRD